MKRLIVLLFISATFLGLTACDNDDDVRYQFKNLKITDANVPDSFELGKTYEIEVTYERPDGCTYLQGFDVYPVENNTTREIVAVGITYEDRNCTQQVTEVTDSFLFKVIYTDDYTFKFYQGNNAEGEPQFLIKNIPVVNE